VAALNGPDQSEAVNRMALEEKASMVIGQDFWSTAPVSRMGIRSVVLSDGPHGLRRQLSSDYHGGLSGSLPATCFPPASTMASSFDPDLLRRVGEALGEEAVAQGVDVVLGPGVNIKRSPLCGRNFEYFSEDPLVSGVLGGALVAGIQSRGVGACVKHFAVNNQETDRGRVSAEVDERTLREIYLPAFERIVIEQDPAMVMCSYNRVNGVYASENVSLLRGVLRGEWGYVGAVVSDWGAVHDRVAALRAGLDLEMPPNHGRSDVAILEAAEADQMVRADLDESVERLVALASRIAPSDGGEIDVEAHHVLAKQAAIDSAVLLTNDGILPLATRAGDVVAVIGEFARTPRYQGAGSSQVVPTRLDNALEALRAAVPDGVDVVFAPGFGVTGDDDKLRATAVDVAKHATVTLVFAGLPAEAETEGIDRAHIDLPAEQLRLIDALLETTTDVVVVLANGSVVRTDSFAPRARAILETWLPGQAGGRAVADLLLGHATPGGRLAETIPLRLEDVPSHLNFPGDPGVVRYGEGVFVGYRGFDALDREVAFPFGHGLTYTTFDYGPVTATVSGTAHGGDLLVEARVSVRNTGRRAAAEVVQLYVHDPVTAVARPPLELRAFEKVVIEPGDEREVVFRLDNRAFAYWGIAAGGWAVEGGDYEIAVGASSRDIRSRVRISLDSSVASQRLDRMSTVAEWLADPVGGPLITDAIGTDSDGFPAGILGDEEMMRVIGNFPLDSLATFPGTGITNAVIDDLLGQTNSHDANPDLSLTGITSYDPDVPKVATARHHEKEQQ